MRPWCKYADTHNESLSMATPTLRLRMGRPHCLVVAKVEDMAERGHEIYCQSDYGGLSNCQSHNYNRKTVRLYSSAT